MPVFIVMKKTILTIFALSLSLNIFASDVATESTENLLTLESKTSVPLLLELYTSQGCSSCPPADRYLNSLKQNKSLFKDFIPMAFHVDYWDYLGWKDPFASKQNSERQRIYRANNKSKSVYTPQFIVDDEEWRGFFKRRKANLKSNYKNPNKLTIQFDGKKLNAHYSAEATNLFLHTALLGIGTETHIPRGENAGKTLKQEFVVLSHKITRSKNNQWNVSIEKPKAETEELALISWVTQTDNSQALQAVADYLPKNIFEK